MTDIASGNFSDEWVRPLLELGRTDPAPEVRLAALLAASHFPLGPTAWRDLAEAAWQIVRTAPAGSQVRRAALTSSASFPLVSLRETLRRMAEDPAEPGRDAIATALAEAGDPSCIRALVERAASGDQGAFRLLAIAPLEDTSLTPADLPPCPEAAFWRALAIGRIGNFDALEDVFAPEAPLPDLFWGSPWVAYDRIAAIRPIPEPLSNALRIMLSRLDDPQFAERAGNDLARALRLTVWAATGMADAEGGPVAPPRPFAPVTAPEPFRTTRSVTNVLTAHIGARQPEHDDGQVAWMIADTPGDRLIREVVALVGRDWPPAARVRLLDILGQAADCQAGCAPTPFRGMLAGPGGGAALTLRRDLIDDRVRSSARPPAMPPPPAPASAARGAPVSVARGAPAPRPDVLDRSFGAPTSATDGPTGAATTAPESDERHVRARIVHEGKQRATFVAGATNTIRCWIGLPEDDGAATADSAIPTVAIPQEGLLLTVELCWGDRRDSTALLLPASRSAPSKECYLHVDVPAEERYVSAEIVFRYRGRIFEAVKVEAAALAPGESEGPRDALRLRVQYDRRQVIALEETEPCAATLVFGDNAAAGSGDVSRLAGSPPTLRVYDGKGGRNYALKVPSRAIDALNAILFLTEKSLVRRLASAPQAEAALDAEDKDVRVLLREMARLGAGLYNQLEQQGFVDPGDRIQFVGLEADAILPLEFVYDRGYPKDAARLCAGWKEALAGDAGVCPACGAAPPDAETRRLAPTICPLGFWSLRKVIERMDPTSAAGASAPRADRRTLPAIDSAVFAASDNVPEEEREATFATIQAKIADATLARHWGEWHDAVKRHPHLLIALAHHDQGDVEDFLEIGNPGFGPDKARLGRGQILPACVNPDAREPGPVLLLLGCRTAAESELGYVQLVREFQKLKTAIVLGTLAQILGRHAAPLARELVTQLVEVSDAEADFGTLMRRVRRRMLARGYLLALCLVALGDAEWRLTPTSRPSAGAPLP